MKSLRCCPLLFMKNSQKQMICPSEPSIISESGDQLIFTSFSRTPFSPDVSEWHSDSRDNQLWKQLPGHIKNESYWRITVLGAKDELTFLLPVYPESILFSVQLSVNCISSRKCYFLRSCYKQIFSFVAYIFKLCKHVQLNIIYIPLHILLQEV